MSEDDENILVDFLVGHRVDNGLRDLRLVHVKVSAQGAPKDTLKCSDAIPGDNTSNESNVHFREALLTLGVSILARGVVLNIAEQGSFIVVKGLTNVFCLCVGLFS